MDEEESEPEAAISAEPAETEPMEVPEPTQPAEPVEPVEVVEAAEAAEAPTAVEEPAEPEELPAETELGPEELVPEIEAEETRRVSQEGEERRDVSPPISPSAMSPSPMSPSPMAPPPMALPPMAPPPAMLDTEDFFSGGASPSDKDGEATPKKKVRTAEKEKEKVEAVAPPRSPRVKQTAAYPYRAREVNEKAIVAALQRVPNRHEYFGYIFSAQSQRPPGFYRNYFLPIYNQPPPRQHILITDLAVPGGKIYKEREAPKNLMPLSAVKIRWALSKKSTVYKLEDIYAYLTRFGPVDGVYPISINSCLVIFSDLEAARAVVACRCLGVPWDRLIATWVEPRMHSYGFYCKYAGIEKPPLRIRM